ncbi:hypothetical protein KIH39_16965 [Telmatocola sphagniphila]|uniref:Uncharacterized protein n=1 Tax=Telmatocola sphagniphila TaxID=1123043 RepID=A0A8E6B2B6_9BACT|nr:hypothetical protein [Telmatocola sphagniphila]QVL30537.1 hypothetical protein KIH39_16965 [Telmatocola sphagniphila]
MAIINQNAAINLQANLALRNRNVVVGMMGQDSSSLSHWRLLSPHMPETIYSSELPTKRSGKPTRVGRLADACDVGCAGRSFTVPIPAGDRTSFTNRTVVGTSRLDRSVDYRDCQSNDTPGQKQGQLQGNLQVSITAPDQGR